MPTRIGNRSYPPVVSDQQRDVVRGLLNDPGWGKMQIGNRSYPDETSGRAPPAGAGAGPTAAGAGITPDLHRYAQGLGKTADALTLPELNAFIDQHYGAQPSPTSMYRLPGNY